MGKATAMGNDQNLSWNCGVEGPTDDPTIERTRNRQVKNFLALMFTGGRRCRCCKWAMNPADPAWK